MRNDAELAGLAERITRNANLRARARAESPLRFIYCTRRLRIVETVNECQHAADLGLMPSPFNVRVMALILNPAPASPRRSPDSPDPRSEAPHRAPLTWSQDPEPSACSLA